MGHYGRSLPSDGWVSDRTPATAGHEQIPIRETYPVKKRSLSVLAIAGLGLAAAAGMFRINTHPEEFIDLDGNGFVSPREALRSLELGQRPTEHDGRRCTEIFALEDSATIRTVCELERPSG